MRAFKVFAAAAAAFVLLAPDSAYAMNKTVLVYCDFNQSGTFDEEDLPLSGVTITITSTDGTFTGSGTTNDSGQAIIALPYPNASYSINITGGLPAGTVVLSPVFPVLFDTVDGSTGPWIQVLVDSPACREGKCWLTGGGGKFSSITGTELAEKGPDHSFGGNVNPGCNEDSGEGGQWNHVAHHLKLHFQGQAIQVVRCGNVPGIPEGSESPVTPFNFIEFTGTGRLVGIKGNQVDYPLVYFFGRAEDRGEPGSKGQPDIGAKDRYFLHVYSNAADPNGSTLLLIDVDGNPATRDPVDITGGNLQIHISSCSTP